MKRFLLSALFIAIVPVARAEEPKSFPAAKHGAGELKFVEKVPVLVVKGKPTEMGEQFGKLAVANAPDLTKLHAQFLEDAGQTKKYPFIEIMAKRLKQSFPPHIVTELEAVAKASGRTEGFLLFANTVADLTSGMGCSTVIVEKDRSKTGSPIFGRNFDWVPTKGITEHTLVVVYKGEGKRAFAAVTVAPIEGVISGMNDAGLCVTINEISIKQSKDTPEFNWKGTPLLLSFRRVLEECGTVAEAEKLLRNMPRTSTCCMTICDKTGGAVFEMTPKNLEVRTHENGVCCCTNHFRSEKLCVDNKCERYDALLPLQKKDAPKLGVKDVFTELAKVQQGTHTLQCMVFEPADRVLHLAYGTGPATKLPPTKLELGKIFDEK
ncbi:Acyl-coenzyme A:6-aminopenicillanic acid acyl-transferase [Gemmata sp. SH-PL17]|uniref:C45 family autoproteolytic acyltransferase/hydolase n=1 Tax=Gemmata sp. SH-PL17 TaxID=1630693 RepID=UPI00078E8E03|nr:C45 family peptidase [Gemmata sp. SH-PL17]AMV26866.1 Acyl-coenzyme A:6-aminopenicillanic acid acyl-transferase [Gemmata sp. SH-PL17]